MQFAEMSDIFISYANEDEERIEPLVRALENNGWSVFWDHRIPAGQTWRSYIGNALKTARCVIVAWSKHSLQSHWVAEEADVGKARNILVPVLLDEVLPPMGFRSIQAADLTDWDGDDDSPELEQLVKDIRIVLDEKKGESIIDPIPIDDGDRPSPNENKSRRKIIIYSLVAIIAVAMLGYYLIGRSNPSRVKNVRETTTEAREAVREVEESSANISPSGNKYFIGRWTNADVKTRGITRLSFRSSGNTILVHAWGACSPKDCDWGEIKTESFGENVSANASTDVKLLRAVHNTSFSVKTLVIKPVRNDRLKVELSTRFTDNSGRSNYTAEYFFQRGP